MIEVVRFKYANHWPVWAIVKDGVVIQCFETEKAAKQALKKVQLA
jgi:hypothetical protein